MESSENIYKWNPLEIFKKAIDVNTSLSTICHNMQNIGELSKLGIWVPRTFNEENKKGSLIHIDNSFLKAEKTVSQEYYYR